MTSTTAARPLAGIWTPGPAALVVVFTMAA